MRTILWLLPLALWLQPAAAYWNYDPSTKPSGGPHRKINELAWKLYLTTKVFEAETKDPYLEHYELKDSELRRLTGDTVITPGSWADDLQNGDGTFNVAGWLTEGGYTADEPEIFMCLRHFYDPTKREGQRYLTDIPWIGEFRELVRSTWRNDVETANPTTDARAWALTNAGNRWGWQQGAEALRRALGPGEATQAQRDREIARAWRALGETMHLLADMTVPAHVRNDGHPGNLSFGRLRPDPYEDLILAPDIEAAYRTIPRTGNWSRLDPYAAMDDVAGGAIRGASSPSALFHSIASYTNEHFLSADTICGTSHDGKVVAPVAANTYRSPLLGVDCLWDDGAGTYNKTFQRRPTVYMVKETWQQNSLGSMLANFGLTIAGGKLRFATNKDCVTSQAEVLVPIAITADTRLIDWFIPRFKITITKIDTNQPDHPLTGKIEHKPYGAYATPIEVTLAKDAKIDLYLDGKRQDPRDYQLKVEKGMLSGNLQGIAGLNDARRIWVEMDLGGIKVASLDYAPLGMVYVTVCEEKDKVDEGPQNPFDTLAGKPIPNTTVVCSYVEGGRGKRQTLKTSKRGTVQFSVPLNVEVTISAVGKEKSCVCTADKPNQGVSFGWQGHQVTPGPAVSTND